MRRGRREHEAGRPAPGQRADNDEQDEQDGGPERWWWALHTHPYLSLRNAWWQWANGVEPEFEADYVIVNDNVRADVLLFPEPVQQRFWSYLSACTVRVASLDDPNYFGIEVYRVDRPRASDGLPGCRASGP